MEQRIAERQLLAAEARRFLVREEDAGGELDLLRVLVALEREIAIRERLAVHDRAAERGMRADGKDHLRRVFVRHVPRNADGAADERIADLDAEFPRILRERLLRPAEREADRVRFLLDELEVRDTREAVRRQLVRLAIHTIFPINELADDGEQQR